VLGFPPTSSRLAKHVTATAVLRRVCRTAVSVFRIFCPVGSADTSVILCGKKSATESRFVDMNRRLLSRSAHLLIWCIGIAPALQKQMTSNCRHLHTFRHDSVFVPARGCRTMYIHTYIYVWFVSNRNKYIQKKETKEGAI
jgi:hypothetical protein